MYDVRLALIDMAHPLKACRTRDGLTLLELATRCGVAARTIHKIEAQQRVPTISVLLKISRGLGCRPEELVRDRHRESPTTNLSGEMKSAFEHEVASDARCERLGAGERAEFEAETLTFSSEPTDPVAALLIVSPAGRLANSLGAPNAAPRRHAESLERLPLSPV